jgi:predicted RNA-binding Zn-ribbon protein involved in translation (DUF1610 family)
MMLALGKAYPLCSVCSDEVWGVEDYQYTCRECGEDIYLCKLCKAFGKNAVHLCQ